MPVHYFHYMLWVCLAAYSIHLLEEHIFDWKLWANKTLGLEPGSQQFYMVNATTVILGLCCAMISWWMPSLSLMFPALMIINGLFFHVLPAIVQRQFSPGLFSSIIVLLPAGGVTYYAAHRDGVLDMSVILISFLGATAFVCYVLLLVKTGNKWRYKAK